MSQVLRSDFRVYDRARCQSAVAAAAFLQRLRLLDRQTGVIHDYTDTPFVGQLVGSFTAPAFDIPNWVDSPEELWNEAERCDPREDAKVAGHLSVPLPPGMSKENAIDFSARLAQYVSTKLDTPVTASLLRSVFFNRRGNVKKRRGKIFRLHLLFPMRHLLRHEGADAGVPMAFGKAIPAQLIGEVHGVVEALVDEAWVNVDFGWNIYPGVRVMFDDQLQERRSVDRLARAAIREGTSAPTP